MRFEENTKLSLYHKTQGICIICNKKIANNPTEWSIEHFIPRAIYKWVFQQNLKSILESSDNLFIVHSQCNLTKDSALPNIKQIHLLPVNDEIKDQVFVLYKSVEESISIYRSIKQSIWEVQERKCAFCQKIISINNATLRRKDNRYDRTKENAMCLCLKCSIRAGHATYKKRMVDNKQI